MDRTSREMFDNYLSTFQKVAPRRGGFQQLGFFCVLQWYLCRTAHDFAGGLESGTMAWAVPGFLVSCFF
jgi:hypothetical protein